MWIELHDTLSEHRKTEALCTALSISPAWAVGILACLWSWSIRNRPDGDLSEVSNETIARACFWKKKPALLVNSLMVCGWLDADRKIHNWQDYAGRLLEKRAASAQRARASRNARSVRAQCPNGAPPTVTDTVTLTDTLTQTNPHTDLFDEAWKSSPRARGAVAQRVVDALTGQGCQGNQLYPVVLSYLEMGLEPEYILPFRDLSDLQLSAALFGELRLRHPEKLDRGTGSSSTFS